MREWLQGVKALARLILQVWTGATSGCMGVTGLRRYELAGGNLQRSVETLPLPGGCLAKVVLDNSKRIPCLSGILQTLAALSLRVVEFPQPPSAS